MGKKSSLKPSPIPPDSYHVFLQAARVMLTVRLANQATFAQFSIVEPLPGHPPIGNAHFAIPTQFLYVFCLELHLKCLLSVRGKKIEKVHDLKKSLFNKLPYADRCRAREHFDIIAKGIPDFQDLKDKYGVSVDLDMVLKSCEYTFLTFRYWFEYNKGSLFPKVKGRRGTRGTFGVQQAIGALGKTILELPECKEWEELFDKAGNYDNSVKLKGGKKILLYSSQCGTLEFTPKKKVQGWPPGL